ncbi:class I SAM-dependent methyltransferase [Undibacterium curvum]|uniref:Class I SAM-dependent methyltransferase n=1 Tax=Undibacterium curvum TaxID=2762294 RepID=A0ABR7A6S3_9BURK|nr:class I SAM-dependent methyltransferase [Undibacterium curvum]MBC3932603.1 class I SAM-dependent methyltransferase [Undibacterium curvum]
MSNQSHWEGVYQTKAPEAVSWYRPHLETSLELILKTGIPSKTAVIDVGGGESTLVDDLIHLGYRDISVFDISQTALEVTKKRLGKAGDSVHWIVGDIVQAELPAQRYDVWHDRAVFHFLTTPEQRAAYIKQVARSVKPGGHVIVATFAPDGPEKCSGLEVARYDAEALHGQFGTEFNLIESRGESHQTPFGTTQAFVYCFCRMLPSLDPT